MAKDLIIRQVKLKDGTVMLELTSPYDPEMVKAAHALAGRWEKAFKKWYFTPDRHAALVAECERIYGTYPELTAGMNSGLIVNTALEAAHEYVAAIKALSSELNEAEKEEVLVALLDSLN